jgi:adenylyltransferase/sulfurtransferase
MFKNDDAALRFGRQIVLPEVGEAGQQKIASARVLVVGAGGLGCPASLYLATMGVDHLTLVDDDVVTVSNLHRQVLFQQGDVGKKKALVAEQRLRPISPGMVGFAVQFSEANAFALVIAHDLVLDCSDNFRTRYLVGDACALVGRPLVTAAISRFDAQIGVLSYDGGPCYRCAFPNLPEPSHFLNCAEAGVLGPFVGMVGSMQALEAAKVILGVGGRPGHLRLFNGLDWASYDVAVAQNPRCPACSRTVTHDDIVSPGAWPLPLPAAHCAHSVPVDYELTPQQLRARMQNTHGLLLVDVRTLAEFEVGHLPGAIHGPLDDILQDKFSPPPDRDIVFYCQAGNRSRACLQHLLQSGHTRIFHLVGGLMDFGPLDSGRVF